MGKWILVPYDVIQGIKNKAAAYLNRTPSAESLKESIDNFIDEELKTICPALHARYGNRFKEVSIDTFKRAINEKSASDESPQKNSNGIFLKKEQKTPDLLEIICYYGYGLPWKDVLQKLNISHDEIKYRDSGEEEVQTLRKESIPTVIENHIENVITNIQLPVTSKSLFQIIDDSFWKRFLLTNDQKGKLDKYYTHADSGLIYYVIANGESIPPEDFVTIEDSDGNTEERTLTEILKNPPSLGIYLIKIILDGGVGKTTLLYWIAHTFNDAYNFISISFIGAFDQLRIIQSAKTVKNKNKLPVVFLLDNASDSSVSVLLERFIQEVQTEESLSDSIFILCDRASRYDSVFGNRNIENIFGGNQVTIKKIIIKKSLLFEKTYVAFAKNNPSLCDENTKSACRDEYFKASIGSLSEQTFFLIQYLKLHNKINYKFDWEDWLTLIESNPSFIHFKHLYAIVACFYQFGINVSTAIQTETLGYCRPVDIVSVINTFGGASSPIELTEDGGFMKLHHEHLAEWFFKHPENIQIAKAFFRRFLTEITIVANAKLLRKIRKVFKLEEFEKSFLSKEFTLDVYISIINSYIEFPATSIEEKKKMLMEKGLALLALNNRDEAIGTFESVLTLDKNNNYAKDQLARLYLNSAGTYDKAFNYYYQIYKNGGTYAMRHIYGIIRKCQEEGVHFASLDEVTFSEDEKLEISALCIRGRHLTQAIKILDPIASEHPSHEVARQFNTIAHYIPYADEAIQEKRRLFTKAIECIKRSSDDSASIGFYVDYAVFLYRIRKFSECTKYRRAISGKLKLDLKEKFEDGFLREIRRVSKLFFVNVPKKEDRQLLKEFLDEQTHNAAANINKDIKNPETIIKGILILHTVRYHAKDVLPEVFSGATLQLGYAYTYHAEKPINYLSTADRKILAENYYDSALRNGAEFSLSDCYDMLRNLQNFQTADRYEKSIRAVQLFFKNPWNKKVPGLYRMLGNAHSFLGNYKQAISDYEKSLSLIPDFRYKSRDDFNGDKAYVYNGIASMICDMCERNISISGYDLPLALSYASQAVVLKPKSTYLKLTLERVKRLLGQ